MARWKASSIVKGAVLRKDHKYHVKKSTGCHQKRAMAPHSNEVL
jgi:hypothetical protein